MSLWWHLAGPWLKKQWRMTVLALFLALSTVFAGIGLLSVAGWFLTGAFLAGSTLVFNLFAPSALVRGLSLWRIASRYAERVVGHSVTLDLQAEIRTQSFARLASFKPAQLAEYRDGDLLARLINDIERLDTFFLLIVTPVVTAVIAGGFFSLMMGMVLPAMGWLLLITLCLAAGLLPYFLAKNTAKSGLAVQKAQADLRAITHDAIEAHTDLFVFDALEVAQGQFDAAGLALAQAQKEVANAASLGSLVQQLLLGLLVLGLLWLGVTAHAQNQLAAPIWVGLLLGAMGLFEIIAPLMRGAAGLGAVQAAAQRIQELTPTTASHATPCTFLDLPKQGRLVLQNVQLRYGDQVVLQNINLSLDQGQRIAIQGLSGVGKTSLLMAIMQIYKTSAGTVHYADVDLNQVESVRLYQRFAFLSQNSPVFMGTVRHNLLLANPEADDEQLWQVLAQVHLTLDVEKMGGLDAWVGEGGNTLSTGQIRRLSLARIVLSGASVWLLDEPTAGLDQQTADAWFNDLSRLAKGCTVIIVTHTQLPLGVVHQQYLLENGALSSI